jgi:alanine racemase
VRAVASVNLAALQRNCARLRRELPRGGRLCVVVKADGYGHGAEPCARAALEGGADWLAVASAGEARDLRRAGLAGRMLVMGALSREELAVAIEADADVVAWTEEFVAGVAALGRGRVHVKLDSGMGRLGTRDPAEADRLAESIDSAPELALAGAMTHFATADERGDSFLGEQLARFAPWARALKERHRDIVVHAANSAATLREPAAHFDMVRCGIAVYGMDPFNADPAEQELEPVLGLNSWVAALKPTGPGESAGYGRRFVARHDTVLAVLPIGYGDGWRRALTNNGEVLIGGRRHPLVGTVSMDNVTVDVGPPGGSERPLIGDDAVLIGAAGAQRITAEEVAARLDTINYEITCGLTSRVPRHHHFDGRAVAWPDGAAARVVDERPAG